MSALMDEVIVEKISYSGGKQTDKVNHALSRSSSGLDEEMTIINA